MQNFKSKNSFLNLAFGYRKSYIIAIVTAMVSFWFAFTIPVVIKNIIDIVLTDQPIMISDSIGWLVNLVGGKNTLTQNLWLAALIIIVLYGAFALFWYFYRITSQCESNGF